MKKTWSRKSCVRLPFNFKKKPYTRKKVHRFALTILPNLTQCTVSLYRRVGTDRSGAHRLRDVSSKGRIVQGTQKPRDALCKGLGDEITLHPKCSRVDTGTNYWKSIFLYILYMRLLKRLTLWRDSITRWLFLEIYTNKSILSVGILFSCFNETFFKLKKLVFIHSLIFVSFHHRKNSA